MICAEMPLAAAKDGLFPDRFKNISKNGVPVYGIIAATALASIAMAINYIGSGGAEVFTTLVLMTGIPVYFAQRGKMTEPEALPEYR